MNRQTPTGQEDEELRKILSAYCKSPDYLQSMTEAALRSWADKRKRPVQTDGELRDRIYEILGQVPLWKAEAIEALITERADKQTDAKVSNSPPLKGERIKLPEKQVWSEFSKVASPTEYWRQLGYNQAVRDMERLNNIEEEA